jgi:hypothetical protein
MTSMQSVLLKMMKKMSDMEWTLVGISKCVSDISGQVTRLKCKVDGLATRLCLCQVVVTEIWSLSSLCHSQSFLWIKLS